MKVFSPLNENTMSRLALLCAWICALVIVTFPIFDWDLYWHLANGREMIHAGQIINEEIFSYTHQGEGFENHEWLAQIIFYALWDLFGAYGLLGLKLLITVLVVSLGYRTARIAGSQPWLAAMLCVFAVQAGWWRYSERPELFSLLNIALVSFILYGFRTGQLSRRVLWLIPPIMVLWNSLHGAVYGLGLLGLFVAGENMKHIFPRLRAENEVNWLGLRTLNYCFAITMLVMLIDPFGFRSYDMFLGLVGGENSAITNRISEMRPITWEDLKPYIFLLAWAGVLALRHIRRIDVTQLILLLVFGALAIRYSRAVGVASIVLIPVIASLMAITIERAQSKAQRGLVMVGMLLSAAFLASYAYNVKFIDKSIHPFGYYLNDKFLPVGSVRFVKAVGLTGNYYNTGHFGGYLSYTLAPKRKIFQFNLHLVFGDTYRFAKQPEELTKWNINYAFVGSQEELVIFPIDRWACIYHDPHAMLVIRRTPFNQQLIQQYELNYFNPTMTDDVLRKREADNNILPRLAEEMGVYLAYRADKRLAQHWARILTANPSLRNNLRIKQLLELAREYNYSELVHLIA
ncbi:MAG: hypothetical protein R8K20_00820 [Gallionellaceae bacterium]